MPTKVLVADDSPTIRRRANATLGEAGYEVTAAEHGEAAWQVLDSGEHFDVVLCDILMPELDGYELCTRIKADERFRDVPVLLLRGTFEPWDQSRAEDAGADGFIAKPFDPESLVGTLQEVLDDAESSASSKEDGTAPIADEGTGAMSADPVAATDEEEPALSTGDAADPFVGGPTSAPPASGDPAGEDSPFGDGEPSSGEAVGEAEAAAAATPPAPPAVSASGSAAGGGGSAAGGGGSIDVDSLDDAALDRLAERLLQRMSTAKIEEIVWEVVPEVAEALVRKRILEIEERLDG